jgi:hypothetical protein
VTDPFDTTNAGIGGGATEIKTDLAPKELRNR